MGSPAEDIKLRDYIDSRCDAILRELDKLAIAMDGKFTSVNELRGLANDIGNRAMPRTEFQQAHESLSAKIDQVQKLTWIGLGIALALQLLIGISVIVWRKSIG